MGHIFLTGMKRQVLTVALAVILSTLLVAMVAQAATTISTNISTAGTLQVDGNSTLGDAVADSITANGYFTQARIGTGATFDFIGTVGADELGVEGAMEVDGQANFDGALVASSTLQVTGAVTTYAGVTLGDAVADAVTANAYFTQLRIGTGSTFDIIGTVGADELGVEGAMEVDGTASFSGLASTSSLKVGDEPAPTVINGIVAGTCTFQSVSPAASSSAFAICTPTTSGSLQSGDYVMVMATSSLALRFQIQSASSTASQDISLQITNSNWPVGSSVATGPNTVQFWAWR